MPKTAVLFALCFMLLAGLVHAQALTPSDGKVTVVQDEIIDKLAVQYRKLSLQNPVADGYRVQLLSESGNYSKNIAMRAREEFANSFPGVKAYLSYKAPNFRVRVGDFHSLTEAVGFQKQIAETYPNSFAVKDKINY